MHTIIDYHQGRICARISGLSLVLAPYHNRMRTCRRQDTQLAALAQINLGGVESRHWTPQVSTCTCCQHRAHFRCRLSPVMWRMASRRMGTRLVCVGFHASRHLAVTRVIIMAQGGIPVTLTTSSTACTVIPRFDLAPAGRLRPSIVRVRSCSPLPISSLIECAI